MLSKLISVENVFLKHSHVSSDIVPHPIGEIVSLLRGCDLVERASLFIALNNLLDSLRVRQLSEIVAVSKVSVSSKWLRGEQNHPIRPFGDRIPKTFRNV